MKFLVGNVELKLTESEKIIKLEAELKAAREKIVELENSVAFKDPVNKRIFELLMAIFNDYASSEKNNFDAEEKNINVVREQMFLAYCKDGLEDNIETIDWFYVINLILSIEEAAFTNQDNVDKALNTKSGKEIYEICKEDMKKSNI